MSFFVQKLLIPVHTDIIEPAVNRFRKQKHVKLCQVNWTTPSSEN